MRVFLTMVLTGLFLNLQPDTANADDFPKAYNTEPSKSGPTPPEKSVAGMQLPPGFKASLFAAEPDVRQPIAMAFDPRGRLWVAENYTYAEVKVRFDEKLNDRIVIFEDANHDGKFDKRTVFWDQGKHLTSVELGFGGVWALCPPNLLFIPDADGDDRPDGKPVVMLDGFAGTENHHTIANGLRWGPDGWLYGRQGIQATSQVGVPGTPATKRVAVNGSIWRFHPTRKTFEVVCEGTTNPWGLDWDQHGQGFFINTVIGHLWHVIPGAHYERMYGQDPNQPNLYGVIQQTANHFHWDTRDSWVVTRTAGVTDGTDKAGGGHAHTGLMIYQGDNWPEAYRNDVYMINFHGRRLNRDHIERSGATYQATHRPDLLGWSDPWFRGIDLITGPDGGVFVADWSDTGECHENDGVHRTSGRIYKIAHGQPKPPAHEDLAQLSDLELVGLQRHPNAWYSRQAQRLLQERAAQGKDMSDARKALVELYGPSSPLTVRLKALWTLHAISSTDEQWLIKQLHDPKEHVRTWAVRLLVDQRNPSDSVVTALIDLAKREKSGLVLTYVTAALQRLPIEKRWTLANAVTQHGELASDRVVPLLLWYGIEPAVIADPAKAAELASGPLFGSLNRSIVRRLAQEETRPQLIAPVLAALRHAATRELRTELLAGLADAHRADRSAKAPAEWAATVKEIGQTDSDKSVKAILQELSVLFGDREAITQLKRVVADPSADASDRAKAILILVRFRPEGTQEILRELLSDRQLASQAVRGLSAFGNESIASLLLDRYTQLPVDARAEALSVLAARPASSESLLKAIKAGRIDRKDVPAYLISQIRGYGNGSIPALVTELWPVSAKARPRIEALRQTLGDGRLPKASLERGHAVFQKTCAQCHKLFGEGGAVGPELTGAQRNDLGYLLENILDPSSTLAPDYRMSTFSLSDGRILNGLAVERTQSALTIQTPTEKIVVKPAEVEEERKSNLSLMPDGLLDTLNEQQVADLFRYLQSGKPTP